MPKEIKEKRKNWEDKLIDLIEEEIELASGVKSKKHFSGDCKMNEILQLFEQEKQKWHKDHEILINTILEEKAAQIKQREKEVLEEIENIIINFDETKRWKRGGVWQERDFYIEKANLIEKLTQLKSGYQKKIK